MRKYYLYGCLLISLALLTNCGFRLRGEFANLQWLSPAAVISKEVQRDLGLLLNNELLGYHVKITPNILLAKYLIILQKDQFTQQITNVSASTIPRQYQLIYRVSFNVIKDNVEFMPTFDIVITRYLTMNNNRILGSMYEESRLKKEMAYDAVIQIINKLQKYKVVT